MKKSKQSRFREELVRHGSACVGKAAERGGDVDFDLKDPASALDRTVPDLPAKRRGIDNSLYYMWTSTSLAARSSTIPNYSAGLKGAAVLQVDRFTCAAERRPLCGPRQPLSTQGLLRSRNRVATKDRLADTCTSHPPRRYGSNWLSDGTDSSATGGYSARHLQQLRRSRR